MHDDEVPGCQLEGVRGGESMRILHPPPCIVTESHTPLFPPLSLNCVINTQGHSLKNTIGIQGCSSAILVRVCDYSDRTDLICVDVLGIAQLSTGIV